LSPKVLGLVYLFVFVFFVTYQEILGKTLLFSEVLLWSSLQSCDVWPKFGHYDDGKKNKATVRHR